MPDVATGTLPFASEASSVRQRPAAPTETDGVGVPNCRVRRVATERLVRRGGA